MAYTYRAVVHQARRDGLRMDAPVARNLLTALRWVVIGQPPGSLGVRGKVRLLGLLRGLMRAMGGSVIILTHNLAVVRLPTDRLRVMKDGPVVEQSLTYRVLDDPQHAYTQSLMFSVVQV